MCLQTARARGKFKFKARRLARRHTILFLTHEKTRVPPDTRDAHCVRPRRVQRGAEAAQVQLETQPQTAPVLAVCWMAIHLPRTTLALRRW